ncbi:MAG TPA: hypothetical protein VMB23_03420 [Spirochaetia bacterium]|nr:hypothetical protein [Spirochaetia bacterium]
MGKSAYGHIKAAQVIGSLPPEEQQELEDLEALRKRTPGQEDRLNYLWARAFDLHEKRQRDRHERAERIRRGEELP